MILNLKTDKLIELKVKLTPRRLSFLATWLFQQEKGDKKFQNGQKIPIKAISLSGKAEIFYFLSDRI